MSLLNISPIDGRYEEKTEELQNYFSEYALIKYRVMVELRWLEYFLKIQNKEVPPFEILLEQFQLEDALKVKEYEKITNHDVKAVEYYLQEKMRENHWEDVIPYIHITLTSEDINNVSYNLMVKDALNDVYLPKLEEFIALLNDYSEKYKSVPMAGHTHGQLATPTTVGKEFKVFEYRLKSVKSFIEKIKLRSKFSGAVGNYNCHVIAFPEIDWIATTKTFIESFGLEYNPVTTQIESHDILCILLGYIKVINNIIKDFNSDCWLYISRGYFFEKTKDGEVGSSVMPHKVNPINHENSMANVELSNSIIDALINNLSISRMQRDLSDSSKMRNLGVIFAHSLLSIKETIRGLNKMEVNRDILEEELEQHYEILAEVIQTILRKNGMEDGYERLKKLSRGKVITKKDIESFVDRLDIPDIDKQTLQNLEPKDYIGLAEVIVDSH